MASTHTSGNRRTRARRFAALAIAIGAAGALTSRAAAAQQPPSLDDVMRQAAARFAGARERKPEAPAGTQPASGAPTMPLTLDAAVKMALDRNLDIAVQRLTPQVYDFEVDSLKAVYRPTISSLIGDLHQTAAPITLLTGGSLVTTHTDTVNGQLSQNVPWGGGNVNVAWNNNRVFSNSFFNNFNPGFNTTLNAQYTQPLMRGFHADAARQQLAVSRVNRAISDLQLQSVITNTVTNVRNAYWDLVLAVESVDVAKTSVDLAHRLVDEAQKRIDAGTMTRLDLVTASSQEATERHTLVVAEGTRRTAELSLKRLLVAAADDSLWGQTIDPVNQPENQPLAIDLQAALKRALSDRTDLAQAKQQVAANTETLKYLRDQTRPQADVVANYALAGLGGSQLVRGGDLTGVGQFTAPVIGTIPGGYGDALGSALKNNYPTWGVALNITYPLGYSAARAETARAQVQANQAAAQMHGLEVQVVTEVTDAAITARNAFDEIDAARQARDLAEQKLDAEQKKFAVGLSTNSLVVQAQKDLADARNAMLRAQITYQKALVSFDRAQQTTLQSAGVTVITTAGLQLPPVGSGRPASAAPSAVFIP